MNGKMVSIIQDYFKTKPVDKVWVFGSFSRGEECPDSDVEIIVTLIPGTRTRIIGIITGTDTMIHFNKSFTYATPTTQLHSSRWNLSFRTLNTQVHTSDEKLL